MSKILEISTVLSSRLRVEEDLLSFASGVVDSYMPANKNLYDQYRRFMHDIVCLGMVEFGYYENETFQVQKIGLTSLDADILKKTPDLYTFKADILRICEVTLSFDPDFARKQKEKTYGKLIEFLRSSLSQQVAYDILVIDLTDSEWADSIPKMSDDYLNLLKRFVSNLLIFHSTVKGSKMRKSEVEENPINFPFTYNRLEMLTQICRNIGVENPEATAASNIRILDLVSSEDAREDYLTKIAQAILKMGRPKRPFPQLSGSDCVVLKEGFEKISSSKKNTTKIPVVFQLGAPESACEIETPNRESIYEFFKHTKHYGGYLDHVKQAIDRSTELRSDGLISLSLTETEFEQEMLAGPGRKKYLRVKNIDLPRKPPTHIGVEKKHIDLVESMKDKLKNMSTDDLIFQSYEPDGKSVGLSLSNAISDANRLYSKEGSSYISKFYQRISTEIILNSMKRRKSREYVLCSSGFEGVFFLVGPGPQLRTESNVEFIKIISITPGLRHSLSREWLSVGDHWETDWLSVDTDRLKHWARAYDRIKLSFLSNCENLVTPENNLRSSIFSEMKHGNLALMTMIYIEDKCNTSTTIQTTRYFFMKSLGDRTFNGLHEKFPSRVSSVLQSYVLQRCRDSSILTSSRPISEWLKLPKVMRDENTGEIDETTATVLGSVPRIFTKGGLVPIQYAINEMYWCMLYNKDRQNPTQDAMKILNKILKEEVKMDQELKDRSDDTDKLKHFFGLHSVDEDIKHILSDKPESHYFSKKAVDIGLQLQDEHPENHAPKGLWINDNKIQVILNKNLSEYATFKASVKEITLKIDRSSFDDIKKIGTRTKCIELIYEMVSDENLRTASDVALSFSGVNSNNLETFIQIFKKNQIGGVREILILYIKSRVLINILEELCRVLSKSDRREILTKGKDKRLMMRGDYEELVSLFPQGNPLMMVKNSYDMSTWCQKFIPTIFLSIYNTHSESLGHTLREFCEYVLLKHCCKKIEYPQKLILEWCKYPEKVHNEPHLQIMKEKFLKDNLPWFMNKSNMGQGILHYNSTVLALSCPSLRDALFQKCLELLGVTQSIRWKTRVGSDDRGDLIVLDLTKKDSHFQARLFEQCSEAAERLHSMELSVKSASGIILYELNSAFMANLEVMSPIIKFSAAAVDMIATDSCTRFVNESYSRIRQLRENGGTSFTCAMAHCLNKEHFEMIFRTGPGMTNDPTVAFGVPVSCIPYDMGVYPMYDCDVQDMIGPEFHNYLVFNNRETPNKIINMLYSSSVNGTSLLPEEDDMMFKKKVMTISRGLVRQLENMKSRLKLSREEIENFLTENPFMIIRGPMSLKETQMIIAAKLYTNGAAESLRRTSPAIYLGRLSAFETAKSWNLRVVRKNTAYTVLGEEVVNEEVDFIKCTYKEFIEQSLEASSDRDMKDFKHIIFPQLSSFEVCKSFVGKFGLSKASRKRFAQAIRTWTLNNYNYSFTNSLRSILETSFGISSEASSDDVKELRKMMPFDMSSYHDFISSCSENGVRPLDAFFYISKFYKNTRAKKAQVFASGPSTVSLNLTLTNIKKYNHQSGMLMDVDVSIDEDIRLKGVNKFKETEVLRFGFNLLMMFKQGHIHVKAEESFLDLIFKDGKTLRSMLETIVRNKRSLSGVDGQTKKMYVFVACCVLDKSEVRAKLLEWKSFCYTYLKRQEKSIDGQWHGDLSIIVSYAKECFLFEIINSVCRVTYRYIRSMKDFEQALKLTCRTLEGVTFESLFTIGNAAQHGIYLDRNLKYATTFIRDVKVLRARQNLKFFHLPLSDLTEFRITNKLNNDSSISIYMSDSQNRRVDIGHFPGHYYPVEIEKNYNFVDVIYLNGMRMSKLFKNRMWFFDQSLPQMSDQESVDFLLNDVERSWVHEVEETTLGIVRGYLDENDELDAEYFEEVIGGNSNNQIETDFTQDLKDKTFFQIFQEAADKLISSPSVLDWADNVNEQALQFTFEDETEEMGTFIRALGENSYKSKKRDFFTITNLNKNLTVMNRILDLFFRGSDIQNERKENLTHYIQHIDQELLSIPDETQEFYLRKLRSYIMSRINILTGRSIESIESFIEKNKSPRHFRLQRLDVYLSGNTDLYKETRNIFDNSDSDSEGEDIYG